VPTRNKNSIEFAGEPAIGGRYKILI
jgi:hypothetical protein